MPASDPRRNPATGLLRNVAQDGLPGDGSAHLERRRKFRHLLDRVSRLIIAVGGISIIVAILLIFFYLIYEVIPLFRAPTVEPVASFQPQQADPAPPLHLALEEQSELILRITATGVVEFYRASDGAAVASLPLGLAEGAQITSFAVDAEESGTFAVGLASGEVLLASYVFTSSYAGDATTREVTPGIRYPFGPQPLPVLDALPVTQLALSTHASETLIAATSGDQLGLLRLQQNSNLFDSFLATGALAGDAAIPVYRQQVQMVSELPDPTRLVVDGDHRWLYIIDRQDVATMLDIPGALAGNAVFSEAFRLAGENVRITQVEPLLGALSLLVADDRGQIAQWFPVRNGEVVRLQRIREFAPLAAAVTRVQSEQRRKNFVALDRAGNVALYNTTAHRELFRGSLLNSAVRQITLSPRGDTLLAETSDGAMHVWRVRNEHPEVSFSALWERVWYEGYDEPDYIWQSSSTASDYEPKYSLVPLSFGTLKAAFYAMLLAAPLAICGAIYTGYFMAPGMRRKVKPMIEMMEALPTVVLGFLAGLWLAPFVERNLLGIFSLLVILPLVVLAASFVWMQLSQRWRHAIPDGWEAALLIPVLLISGYLAFALAAPLEQLLFAGDLRFWITDELGISYDQRNAMVVGFAMGFAVVPTIFSIAEDAIFTVPKQLTYGSLALGSTPWQSLYRVVLPTASPGIFSALMIGMGRAVGETMIVLMATGNTPIMDVNIFEGMRTLAANIAVEIPESEVDSSHYRILFLAALVLFMFTFFVNTLAEIVRQRLRVKYSEV